MVIVKDQSSHLVYLNICIKWQTCGNFSSIGRRSCEKLMKEKKILSHHGHRKLYAFRCLISIPQNNSELSRNRICGKLLLSRKIYTSHQRELFLTMFYTINLSSLLVIKKGFMMIIILRVLIPCIMKVFLAMTWIPNAYSLWMLDVEYNLPGSNFSFISQSSFWGQKKVKIIEQCCEIVFRIIIIAKIGEHYFVYKNNSKASLQLCFHYNTPQ